MADRLGLAIPDEPASTGLARSRYIVPLGLASVSVLGLSLVAAVLAVALR